MKRLKHREFIKKRQNYLPTLATALIAWIGWLWVVYYVSPSNNLIIFAFLFLLFTAAFLTASLLLANSRRGFLLALGIVGYLVFRYHRLDNILSLLIYGCLLICLELYFMKSKSVDK